MSEWQPINTAERSNRVVLGLFEDQEGKKAIFQTFFHFQTLRWQALDPSTQGQFCQIEWSGPTHWMPLPERPL